MRKRILQTIVGAFVMLGVAISQGWSYEEMVVEQGGAIQGTVILKGDDPKPMAFNLVTIPDPVYCGRISTGTGWRIVEDFIVNPDGRLKDVVVMLQGVKKGKSFTLPNVKIKAKDCDFYPFVNVLRDQDEIQVINMDPVQHDIQGYETARVRGARVLFNRPLPMNPFHQAFDFVNHHKHLPGKLMTENIHLTKGRNIFVMQCGFHPYMFSWGVVIDNPYYAITKEDGRFEISNIPPGEYLLTAWHAGMKRFIKKTINVKPNETVEQHFEYESPKGRRSVHEMHENPHFGLEMLDDGVEVQPSLRRQQTS